MIIYLNLLINEQLCRPVSCITTMVMGIPHAREYLIIPPEL